MATKETQSLILETAVELFNQSGIAKVSANKIAEACKISKGNLHYHFKNKESIIHSIYDDIAAEIRTDWHSDDEHPTIEHMAIMFRRQLLLIWRYRFFYRELIPLLAADEHLKYKFSVDRAQRTEQVFIFFKALRDSGLLSPSLSDGTLESLVKISWILSDNWINYIEVDQQHKLAEIELNDDYCRSGYHMIIDLFRPYLTETALRDLAD